MWNWKIITGIFNKPWGSSVRSNTTFNGFQITIVILVLNWNFYFFGNWVEIWYISRRREKSKKKNFSLRFLWDFYWINLNSNFHHNVIYNDTFLVSCISLAHYSQLKVKIFLGVDLIKVREKAEKFLFWMINCQQSIR